MLRLKIKIPIIILLVLIVSSLLLMIFSSLKDSATTDESIHLFSGYTYLTKRDFRLDVEHPPLLKELAAFPLLFFQSLQAPIDGLWDQAGNYYYDAWSEARLLGESFTYSWGNNPASLLFWGRLPFIILTLMLGIFGYFWAKKLYGIKAGLLAGFLILFSPNILAHGRLINTDLGLTLFIFLSVYFWGKFLKKPIWINLIWAGIFLGLVLAAKFTGILILPILFLLAFIKFVIFDNLNCRNFGKYLLGYLGAILIALLIVWLTYGFSVKAPPEALGSLSANYKIPTTFDNYFDVLRPVLIPADYYKGIFLVGRHALGGHGSYLLGQGSNYGWWYYFPVAIFFKTPISIFILLGLAIAYWRKLKAKDTFDEYLLIIPPIIFLILSMFSKANLGIRHILPIFPFIFVYVSKTINLVDFSKLKMNFLNILIFILIIWYLFSALISFPNYLAYFNEFAGGSKNAYKYLNDSNLDWGQDIYRIRDYLKKNNISQVYLVYPWDGDPALKYYGINYLPLNSNQTDVRGKVVISATYLEFAYQWLKVYPSEQITPGVFIFDVR